MIVSLFVQSCSRAVWDAKIKSQCFSQGLSLRAIWAKYSPQGSKFRPRLVSGRSGSLPKKKNIYIFFFFFFTFSSCKHTIEKL